MDLEPQTTLGENLIFEAIKAVKQEGKREDNWFGDCPVGVCVGVL